MCAKAMHFLLKALGGSEENQLDIAGGSEKNRLATAGAWHDVPLLLHLLIVEPSTGQLLCPNFVFLTKHHFYKNCSAVWMT